MHTEGKSRDDGGKGEQCLGCCLDCFDLWCSLSASFWQPLCFFLAAPVFSSGSLSASFWQPLCFFLAAPVFSSGSLSACAQVPGLTRRR